MKKLKAGTKPPKPLSWWNGVEWECRSCRAVYRFTEEDTPKVVSTDRSPTGKTVVLATCTETFGNEAPDAPQCGCVTRLEIQHAGVGLKKARAMEPQEPNPPEATAPTDAA